MAGVDRFDGGVFGRLGDVEIGKPDGEVDRVLQLRGQIEDLADARSIDSMSTGGDVRIDGAHGVGWALPTSEFSVKWWAVPTPRHLTMSGRNAQPTTIP